MFQTRLKLILKGSSLSLTLPLFNRILYELVAALLVLGIFYTETGARRLWIPGILAFLSFLGGMYTEKWVFNSKSRRGTYYRGIAFLPLPFLTEHITFNFDDIEIIKLEKIHKHKTKTESFLLIFLKTGEKLEIDSAKGGVHEETFRKTGMIIADFTGTGFNG